MEGRIKRLFGVCEMNQGKVIVKLNGGLGNQMFQWALARMIQETTGMDVELDMSYFSKNYARPYQLDIFSFEPDFVEDLWTKIRLGIIWAFRKLLRWETFLGFTVFSEKSFNFDTSIHRIKPNTFIEGFFQSEMYFKCIEERIRNDFRFASLPDDQNRKAINMITEGPSIAIHVRRGDYVEKQRYQDSYAVCSPEYYKSAVEYIAKSCPNPTLFVFSDDIKWAKRNLKLPYECVYISHNTGKKNYEDMRLMSLCTHNVIANSTFSWWAAWLNSNPDKIVVAPKRWFNDDKIVQTDIIPKEWIRIEN